MPIDRDTVARHGLSTDELERILRALGREPSLVELGVFSVMWSEHCSYKSSRRLLRGLPTSGPRVLQGPGENAGVIDIGGGWAAAFKMESHNHPSYIEPYQGAATGVGGILRDVFTMGARPICSLNSLRFGDPSHPRTAHLMEGVVAGIGGYGNCVGVATVGGEVAFDACYNDNCLVNAFTLGILRADQIFRGTAAGVGNRVIYVGAKTGRDGIHGATMASAEFDESSEEKRPTVQVGDPFTEKLLLEACLELFAIPGLVVGIQDMGAAGLTSSSVEMAARAGNGLRLDLDQVPLRESGMTPYEILLSESQERMLLVAARGREREVFAVFQKWDLDAAVVGEVTASGRWVARWHGEVVADLPVRALTDDAPVYDRPRRPPERREADFDPLSLPAPGDLGAALVALMTRPTIASKEWIYRQYDHDVRLVGALRPGEGDAAVVRVTGLAQALALTVDVNARFCFLDPREGARLAVAENYRNLCCVGAEPLAVTDCLNFGNPEKPEVMWQLAEAVEGIAEACRALGTPVVSGNVSLYNETEGRPIHPTPTVAMVGLVEDPSRTAKSFFTAPGDRIVLLGRTLGQLGGSEYLAALHGRTAGRPPRADLDLERRVGGACRRAVREGLVHSAHDCSEGGLAVALAECCVAGGGPHLGARVGLSEVTDTMTSGQGAPTLHNDPEPALQPTPARGLRADQLLFGEDPARIVLSASPGATARILALAAEEGAPASIVGEVGGDRLIIDGLLDVPIEELSRGWCGGLLTVLGR